MIYAAIGVWLTNIIVFALWFWEIDRGGPITRARPNPPPPGFLVSADDYHRDHLGPVGTRATTFSPTDTMPLTRPVKMLMFIQPLASLTTIAIVGARAVNILS